MERLIELVVQGTLIGSLYALVALGFVLIYKASRVINFAQGELVMMGYLGVAFTALYGVPWPLAFLLTIAISAAVGVGIERTVLRPLIGRPLVSVVMATIALAVFIRGVLPTIWAVDHGVSAAFAGAGRMILGVRGLAGLSGGTRLHRPVHDRVRPVFQDEVRHRHAGGGRRQRAAASVGISVRRVFATSWAIAAVVPPSVGSSGAPCWASTISSPCSACRCSRW